MNRIIALFVLGLFSSPALANAQGQKEVILSEEAKSNIGFLFDNLRVEFAFCAYGRETAKTIHINRIALPIIYVATPDRVAHAHCHGRGLIADGHPHYVAENCDLSGIDRGSFVLGREKYTLLICTASRYKLYSRREIESSYTKTDLKIIRAAAKLLAKFPPH